jgi:hypothetical protein
MPDSTLTALATLQRHNTENLKQIFPEMELRGLSPNFHNHVSHNWSSYSATGNYVDRSWEYINRSPIRECGRAIPFLGIHKWDFRCSVRGQIRPPVSALPLPSLWIDPIIPLHNCGQVSDVGHNSPHEVQSCLFIQKLYNIHTIALTNIDCGQHRRTEKDV